MFRLCAFVQEFVCSSPSMALIDGHYENKTVCEKTFQNREDVERFLKENYPNHICTIMNGNFSVFRASVCGKNSNVRINITETGV